MILEAYSLFVAQIALFGPKRSGSCRDGYPVCRTWNFYVDVEGANDAARDTNKLSARQNHVIVVIINTKGQIVDGNLGVRPPFSR